jgi:hypothetical protein
MAARSETEITVTVSGDGIASEWTVAASANTAAPGGGPIKTTLSAGDNYLTVPTGTRGFLLRPAAASAVTKRIKHHAGETGFALRTGEPAYVPIATGVATLMVHASAQEVVDLHWT